MDRIRVDTFEISIYYIVEIVKLCRKKKRIAWIKSRFILFFSLSLFSFLFFYCPRQREFSHIDMQHSRIEMLIQTLAIVFGAFHWTEYRTPCAFSLCVCRGCCISNVDGWFGTRLYTTRVHQDCMCGVCTIIKTAIEI